MRASTSGTASSWPTTRPPGSSPPPSSSWSPPATPTPLLGLFADDAELLRPEVAARGSSTSDPAAYWQAYLDQFDEISTDFDTVREAPRAAWLEWHSTGRLSTGRDVSYSGVSLLDLDDDGRVTRFATYYDTAAFLEPADRGDS
ncbi:nuclear transport factor 2 family protein [Nocardioides sp. TF02-7]|uniref:nuclear transport factor 2 family protein n=1 Tax=Nocardioides sp. TF02-7 TaxID=2917724 RepID=UPI001F066103|nr:nuclear transport factor 2 family protein [Nocardioides sp. TF02-7]UMG92124.1 nuclear transport factor 2 family protein [Nocardioides sp. TF02-7]